jgi:GNAT superfamily N-acetyltransferase
MTMTDAPWVHPNPAMNPRLRLVRVPLALLHALGRGETVDASPITPTPFITGDFLRDIWGVRSRQVIERPDDGPWVTRLIMLDGLDTPIGTAGFHGPPDERGMVEVGYSVDPLHRRRGYARAALETTLAVARQRPEVDVVRAVIRPDNVASRALAESQGFAPVGEHWDEVDGRELVYERSALSPHPVNNG